ncbi:MinD/ParA family protein [Rhodococcus sp. SBT000017]|nr:MinD/ParA family protein [Rhodococcus sp. SBT000017]
MPPESISDAPVTQPEAAPTPPPVSAPRPTQPKDGSGPVEGGNAVVAATPAAVDKTATAKPVEPPKPPVASTVKPTPSHTPPVASGPPPPRNQVPQNPVPQNPVPQNWAPQNDWAPQNHWAPQNFGGPQNQAGQQNYWAPQNQGGPHGQLAPEGQWNPQNQWNAQNQWGPQPGQWPQPQHQTQPHQNLPHPSQPQQLRQGAVDALVVAPGAVPAIDPSRSGEQPVSSLDLGSSLLVRSGNVPPVAGWRRALYLMSGGRVDVGNSAAQQRRLVLTAQVDRPLVGCHRVAVLSLKGGVGKTTTTATLGSTFAEIRGDRVIAIDANPDRGTLGQKVPPETTATVRNLLRDIESLDRYSDVRAYTSQNAHRLEVLASDSDPAASEAFSGEDYDRAVSLLEKFYSIVITDCGTGLMHSAMESILEGADTLVVVSSGSVDGVRSASATLDWLDAHGYRELVATSVAVVNGVRPRPGKVDLEKVVEHFEQRCARVRTIPFDPHLEEGAEIELDRLRGRTRKALLEVAAAVAAGFPDAPTAPHRN